MGSNPIAPAIYKNSLQYRIEAFLCPFVLFCNETALLDFFKSAKDCGRLGMGTFEKEKLLISLGLLIGNKLNNAGFALFGKNAKIGLKLSTYPTSDKALITDLKLVNGNIYNLINVAIDYIMNRINWRIEIGSRKRDEIPEIPERALREIIVMNNGIIEEKGPHQELLNNNGLYKKMWNAQVQYYKD